MNEEKRKEWNHTKFTFNAELIYWKPKQANEANKRKKATVPMWRSVRVVNGPYWMRLFFLLRYRHNSVAQKNLVMFQMSNRSARWFAYKFYFICIEFFVLFLSVLSMDREMLTPQRLACVSETNEEGAESLTIPVNGSPENRSPSLKRKTKKNSTRKSSNQLHVTINDKPEDIDCDANSLHSHSNSSSRRPSVMMQEILQTRRPSAIMAALRSPKQFVNRYRREYVIGFFFWKFVFACRIEITSFYSLQIIDVTHWGSRQWACIAVDEEKSTFWRVGIEIVYTIHRLNALGTAPRAPKSYLRQLRKKFNQLKSISLVKWMKTTAHLPNFDHLKKNAPNLRKSIDCLESVWNFFVIQMQKMSTFHQFSHGSVLTQRLLIQTVAPVVQRLFKLLIATKCSQFVLMEAKCSNSGQKIRILKLVLFVLRFLRNAQFFQLCV